MVADTFKRSAGRDGGVSIPPFSQFLVVSKLSGYLPWGLVSKGNIHPIFLKQWEPLQVEKKKNTLVAFLKPDTLEISRQTVQNADDRFNNKHQMIEGPKISLGNMRFMVNSLMMLKA